MGSITYSGLVVHIDDRTLTHLEIVIVNKFRRGESFLMSWADAPVVGSGRSAVWMHPKMLLHFKFEGGRVPAINQEWLDELQRLADSSRGLIVIGEHGHLARLSRGPASVLEGTTIRPSASPEAGMPAAS